ncbi:sulfite exporter TauE/SafE family protein [Flavihumibacter fluvii]|uniref:sulfite exporter TauE/SafE family protein n=1 Tax=Flavihumibacter fluvii TaxID=2838157 RepID=UPI001BDE756F|nr:sulfite exporter TauE/SafE family protein [Flavihumibacter fluvii]ULQ50715.1 sulfite exporter TauE/SafE family protein [Flavihumibacter fluvii]
MDALFHQTFTNWLLIILATFIIGLSKAGLKGIEMMNVTIMAIVFGSKASTGIVLPLLCAADIMAVKFYHRHAQWPYFWKLIPWMAAGILVGVLVGKDLDEALFRKIMAVIIAVTVIIMIWMESRKNLIIPDNKIFTASMGLTAGFTTMLGNLAGTFSNIYFLAMRMLKNEFIGTAAWVFLVINLFKLPFQVIYWKNINWISLQTDLYLLPALIAGFWAGLWLVARIKDDSYRKVVIVLTLIGAGFIFFK